MDVQCTLQHQPFATFVFSRGNWAPILNLARNSAKNTKIELRLLVHSTSYATDCNTGER